MWSKWLWQFLSVCAGRRKGPEASSSGESTRSRGFFLDSSLRFRRARSVQANYSGAGASAEKIVLSVLEKFGLGRAAAPAGPLLGQFVSLLFAYDPPKKERCSSSLDCS